MKADEICACLSECSGQRIDRFNHQMHVNRNCRAISFFAMRFECLTNHRAKGEVGYIVVVHHVKVNPVSACCNHGLYFVAQAGKVGRQDGGGKAIGWFCGAHGWNCATSNAS